MKVPVEQIQLRKWCALIREYEGLLREVNGHAGRAAIAVGELEVLMRDENTVAAKVPYA